MQHQKSIEVYFKGKQPGQFYADLIVDKVVIVEINAVERFVKIHVTQLLNYLKQRQSTSACCSILERNRRIADESPQMIESNFRLEKKIRANPFDS